MYQARCKRAAIVYDWLAGDSVADIEQRYTASIFQGSISYGDIQRIADATRFHLRSAHRILAVLFPENPELLTELDRVLERLELNLPVDALGLRELPVRLERGEYLALFHAGCTGAADVEAMSFERLAAATSRSVAMRLKPVAASA